MKQTVQTLLCASLALLPLAPGASAQFRRSTGAADALRAAYGRSSQQTPFQLTAIDSREHAGATHLLFTFNKRAHPVSVLLALRIDGRAVPQADIFREEPARNQVELRAPLLQPGRYQVALSGARTEGVSPAQRLDVTRTLTVRLPASLNYDSGQRSWNRTWERGGFGARIESGLRARRQVTPDGLGLRCDFDAGGKLYGKLFGSRWLRAIDASVHAEAVYSHANRQIAGRGRAQVIFGEGSLSYTWTPFDASLSSLTAQRLSARPFHHNVFHLSTTLWAGPIPIVLGADAYLNVELYLQARLNTPDLGFIGAGGVSQSLVGSVYGGIGISGWGFEIGVMLSVDVELARAGLELPVLLTTRGVDCRIDLLFSQSVTLSIVVRVRTPWYIPIPNFTWRKELARFVLSQIRLTLISLR